MATFRKLAFVAFVSVLAMAYLRDQADRIPTAYVPLGPARFLLLPPDTQLEMPLRNVRVRQIANTWHAPRDGHKRLHEGQDIFAPKGTPVYSATDGVVIRVGDAGIGGNAVSVLGGGGRVYYYAHLSKFADGIAPGDLVTPDTLLGYVGNTGNARTTPSHLHFGVYAPNGAINPLPLLTDRRDTAQTAASHSAPHVKRSADSNS